MGVVSLSRILISGRDYLLKQYMFGQKWVLILSSKMGIDNKHAFVMICIKMMTWL